MGLTTYRRKRNFKKTAEPAGASKQPSARRARTSLSFVIQQHHASHAHYDFRLEMDGVLKSWAVPKGPSLDPADKRLAVEVEDHPIEYAGFEGVIPKGQYGGGSVIVWDQGTWELDNTSETPAAAHRRGSMKFTLRGKKLHGRWALVRMKSESSNGKPNWLLIKEKDRHARPRDDYDILARRPKSVLSGKTIEAIDDGKARVWNSKAATPRARSRSKKTRSSKPRRAKTSDESHAAGLSGATPGHPPDDFRPQLATLVEGVPTGADWAHEVKFDGYRIVARIEDNGVRLLTRQGNDWTAKFPETAAALSEADLPAAILDGELVALDPHGLSRFQDLQQALKSGRTDALVYYVFDVPFWQGFDLRACRFDERRELLRVIAQSYFANSTDRIRLSEAIAGQGPEVLQNACRLHLEGIISKRVDSPYESARTSTWRKVKCGHRQEFVIGGFTEPKGARAGFGALLIGYFNDNGELQYAGKVGAGFDEADLGALIKQLRTFERDNSPFADPPRGSAQHWTEPAMVVEIGFTEWTQDGRLRHPVFLGVREDKEAIDVKREQASAPKPRAARVRPQPGAKKSETEPRVAGVRISSPDRVVYPDQGLTKMEIVRYYEEIADQILPLVRRRPLSLVRCPSGSKGACFFQKHMKIEAGAGLQEVSVDESKATTMYAAITKLSGLIYLVQMNTLELHAWGARADNIERPDRLVFDLDPGEGAKWLLVVEAARKIQGLFEQMGLETFTMTSGGKGLHVVVPIQRKISWDTAKSFAHAVASSLEQAEPNKFIANMSKEKRRRKVFIDYLRVQRGATSIVPYSTRARPGAPVAMPVEWDEIEIIRPDQFNVKNARKHVDSRTRDPWEHIDNLRQSLPRDVLPG